MVPWHLSCLFNICKGISVAGEIQATVISNNHCALSSWRKFGFLKRTTLKDTIINMSMDFNRLLID